jgi:2-polyprenyl-3-methyl-5-hydroxy-6-metoxy-1,4-benzoquinol methylase
MMNEEWDQQRSAALRFDFGQNWTRFSKALTPARIELARQSMVAMLGTSSLSGFRFLDAGCGSGLFSLCARQLGAEVVSFDFDPYSVECTRHLRNQYSPDDVVWGVQQGSVLDLDFVCSLGHFDIVYSWGVLHHTDNMSQALANATQAVKKGGRLYISIYNDQGAISRYWWRVKRAYNRYPALRPLIIAFHTPYLYGARVVYRALSGKKLERGMSLWYDMIDWLGGYPFEVARPEHIVRFYRDRGFELLDMTTCGGNHGCNEFVFRNGPSI